MSNTRVQVVLNHNVPSAAESHILICDKLLILRGNSINKLMAPYNARDVKGKAIFADLSGKLTQLSVDKVKQFREWNDFEEGDQHHGNEIDPAIEGILPLTHVTECDQELD